MAYADISVARRCVQCGKEFDPRNRTQRFCSRGCNAESQRTVGEHVCKNCSVVFRPKANDRTVFCCRQCGVDYKRRERPKKWRWPRTPVSFPTCRHCGRTFAARRTQGLCSDECRKQWACARSVEHGRRQKPFVPRPCKECGEAFTPEYGNKRRNFCSASCLKKHSHRAAAARRRARLRGGNAETVSPLEIFMRDGWRCKLCNRKTPKRLRGTIDERAPELDHIVPIAKGGDHTQSNVLFACRACTTRKSDGPGGQLILFG